MAKLTVISGWATKFDDPISLPDGRELVTLREAADYITKLPKTEQDADKWQIAVGMLINAAENGGGCWCRLAYFGQFSLCERSSFRLSRKN